MVERLLDTLSNLPDESWVAKPLPDNGGDVFWLDPVRLDSNSVDCNTTSPQSGSELTLENSSEADASLVSSQSDPIDIPRMHRPPPICQISGPGFTSSSTSSGGVRRQHSRSDVDYVDSHIKQPHFTPTTSKANATER